MSEQQSNEPKRGSFAGKKGEIIIREHEYDGIQEYDQKLPNWWLFTFYGAIAWFLVYWVLYYNAGAYQTDHEKVTGKIAEVEAAPDRARSAERVARRRQALLAMAKDPGVIAAGREIYTGELRHLSRRRPHRHHGRRRHQDPAARPAAQ
jgi:cytochrome c oxidase cbb3-type subunit 3